MTLHREKNELRSLVNQVVRRLSNAVQIPTVVTDGMGLIGEDPAWDIFYKWSTFLEQTFPKLHQRLDRKVINEHGHIFTWQGSIPSLKPLLLMAHSDVVPVEESSAASWTHPPFSGHRDGEFVWGRGSEDNKSNLVVMLSVVEYLVEQDWKPVRTILLCFGFDEEGGADQSYGARCIAEHLEGIYGPNGVEMIIDENYASVTMWEGQEVAIPALSEKGYLDVEISLTCPGGNSAYPPIHTGVGLLAKAICLIEDNPLPYMQPTNSGGFRRAVGRLKQDSQTRTTTAVTMFRGGEKVNSLPEVSRVLINHRIAAHDSVFAVKDHYTQLLLPWAKKYELNFDAFDGFARVRNAHGYTTGTARLTAFYDLEPSPISPTSDPCYALLQRAIRRVFGDHITIFPDVLAGNTDTRYYWSLTKNIYRISPFRATHDPRGTRLHTVDERMPIRGLREMVEFYLVLIEENDDSGMMLRMTGMV